MTSLVSAEDARLDGAAQLGIDAQNLFQIAIDRTVALIDGGEGLGEEGFVHADRLTQRRVAEGDPGQVSDPRPQECGLLLKLGLVVGRQIVGQRIVAMDPWGATIASEFAAELAAGYDNRPTIAVTQAHVILPEVIEALQSGRLKADGKFLTAGGAATVTKVAVEPVWFLPEVARRFGCTEAELRRVLFEETGGMYPELVTRSDLEVFLPPIGGLTAYIFGNPRDLANPEVELTARVHDECNGSDVFGSDICTCRPYLTHAIEECIMGAQRGGVGLVSYFRKEGRALGEVTKFLVYNARKRQVGGDTADQYFNRTECVAGVQDMRFQELMPDVLNWLGIRKIHRLVSMSNMKYDAITRAGIEVVERVNIPDHMIPEDAQVEMDAKKAAGYFTPGHVPDAEELKVAKGRGLDA